MKTWGFQFIGSIGCFTRALVACAAILLLSLGVAVAQDQEAQVDLEPLAEEVTDGFDLTLTSIALQNVDVQQLQGRIESSEG